MCVKVNKAKLSEVTFQLTKYQSFSSIGIEVKPQPDGSILLTQGKYIKDFLAKTNMTEAKPISSPMVTGCKLAKTGSEPLADPPMYSSVAGALQ